MPTLLTSLALSPLLAAGALQDAEFEAPVEITADGKDYSQVLYPSPVLYDLDGDGQGELVIGDLFGHVYAAERISAGDPSGWGPSEKLKTADGHDLKFSNW